MTQKFLDKGVIELPFDNLLYQGQYELGESYWFKITYLDDHVEYGQLKYVGPHRNPTPVSPGSNEHLTIPMFHSVAPHVTEGYGKTVERVSR